jgi:hypothetical protein
VPAGVELGKVSFTPKECQPGKRDVPSIKAGRLDFPFACCLLHLPLLDELRTYCYEHQIEEIPALLAV